MQKLSSKDYNAIRDMLRIDDKVGLLEEFYELDKNFVKNQMYLLKNRSELKYKVRTFFFYWRDEMQYVLIK